MSRSQDSEDRGVIPGQLQFPDAEGAEPDVWALFAGLPAPDGRGAESLPKWWRESWDAALNRRRNKP